MRVASVEKRGTTGIFPLNYEKFKDVHFIASSEALGSENVPANIRNIGESDALDHPINAKDLQPIALTSKSLGEPSTSYSEAVNVVSSTSALRHLTHVPTTS